MAGHRGWVNVVAGEEEEEEEEEEVVLLQIFCS